MRDLANQNYSSGKAVISTSAVRIFLILIFVLGVLFILKKAVGGGTVGGASIVLKDAPRGLKPVEVAATTGIIEDALDLSVDSAKLSSVSDLGGSGTASRKYGDGSYSLTVNANLVDPKGDEYQAWIVGDGQVIKAGKMDGSGNSWGVVFNDKDKYSKLDEIWVTREITGKDEKPEKHVLEGSF